jgi:hypothetical protein
MRFAKQKRASSEGGIRGFSIAKNFLNSFLSFLVRFWVKPKMNKLRIHSAKRLRDGAMEKRIEDKTIKFISFGLSS